MDCARSQAFSVCGVSISILNGLDVADHIVALQFSPNGRYMAVAAGKHVLLFNNVPGYQNAIEDLEERKKGAASASIRDRLQAQIDEARCVHCGCVTACSQSFPLFYP